MHYKVFVTKKKKKPTPHTGYNRKSRSSSDRSRRRDGGRAPPGRAPGSRGVPDFCRLRPREGVTTHRGPKSAFRSSSPGSGRETGKEGGKSASAHLYLTTCPCHLERQSRRGRRAASHGAAARRLPNNAVLGGAHPDPELRDSLALSEPGPR